jgi:hypothetical protein
MKTRIALGLFTVAFLVASSLSADPRPALEKRAVEIVPLLSDEPVSFGGPVTDRAAWGKIAAGEYGARILAQAEKLVQSDPEPLPDELFLDYSRTGKRLSWEEAFGRNRERLKYLALAECLENRGRFLPALGKVIDLFCSLKTWEKPAHDAKLDNFYGRREDIDLESSSLAFELALVLRLLPGKLPAATADRIRKNIDARVLSPYRDMVYGRIRENSWMRANHNWNAVCHAGVVGAALTLPLPKSERAVYIAAAEQYLPYYIAGFGDDGYCVEGADYWNYGFGHYLMLAEMIGGATGGRIDFLAGPKLRRIAEYGFAIELAPGAAPAFADADPSVVPDRRLLAFLKARLGLPEAIVDPDGSAALSGPLQQALFFLFPSSAEPFPAAARDDPPPPRSYFEDAGVLVCRPAAGSSGVLSAAIKGGRNAGNHSHADTGTFVVAAGSDIVLTDPGAEVYTARTFSDRRFESKLINSWGHPVPVVAGRLQAVGPQAAAKVLAYHPTDKADAYVLDLTACYPVPDLKSLVREFVFSRAGDGEVDVKDSVTGATPETFETALVTYGAVRVVAKNGLVVLGRSGAVSVDIDAAGAPFTVKVEPIDEETRTGTKPTRIGIVLSSPVVNASVSVRVRPWRPAGAGLLPNGGFEYGDWGWTMGRNGMARVERGRKAAGDGAGEAALFIKDDSATDGSSVYSAPVAVREKTAYVLTGKVLLVDGADCGVYVKFFDKDGRLLGTGEDQLNVAPKAVAASLRGAYSPWHFEFTTPPGCAELAVWVHSYNAAKVTLYLDDLTLAKKGE